jgi:hypothetical protein
MAIESIYPKARAPKIRDRSDRALRPRAGTMRFYILLIIATFFAGAPAAMAAPASTAAEAAQKPPLSIAIFYSSRVDVCFDPGDIPAIRKLAAFEQDRINRQGGINGRRLDIRFFDDQRDAQKSIANMRSVLADPYTVAMIGMSNSTRAKATFDALGHDIAASGIPFLSDISLNSIFADHPNVFTMRASQDDERMPVLIQFIKQMNYARPGFVGIKDALFSTTLGDGLKAGLGEQGLVADHRLRLKDNELDPAEVATVVADLKEKDPDLLFLNVGSSRIPGVMKRLTAAGVTPNLIIGGRIDSIPVDVTKVYPGNLYQLAWDGLPDAYSERLRKLISRSSPEDWVFEGRKVSEAPGWKSGECKARPSDATPNPLQPANLRAIGAGAQFSDMVGLIAAATHALEPDAEIADIRKQVLEKLKTIYVTGRGTFQGSFENWSFRPKSRAAARTPFIVMLAQGMARSQLAPLQFVRLRDESLRAIETLYLDVDLVKASRIDDNEKTFFAEFYVSMRDSKDASINRIEFANAFLDPRTNDRQITVRTLHEGGKSSTYPESMKIYHVSGKFTYEPQLSNYPFDVQRYAIDLRPKLSDAPFVVQPPPQALRDGTVDTDGWDPKEQYVAYDEDFVRTLDARTHQQSVVPFYKASFVWLMKRQTTDYYLRVVAPLAFILLIAYMSIFIPVSHFEAIVTIQVTALLSAVALYLALPKVDSDTATLSDRIFLFNYMAFSLMITISIVRMNRFVASRKWLQRTLGFIHVVVIPVLVGAMAVYVQNASTG